MPVRIQIDETRQLVVVTVTGELTDDTLLELRDEIAQHPGMSPAYSLLVDLTAAEGSQVTNQGVRGLVERPLVLSETARRAVIVPSDLGYGIARMYGSMRDASGGGFQIYRDRAEAEAWLCGGDE